MTDPPRIPPEKHEEEAHARESHLDALREADETLEEAQEIIIAGRARLQESILAYQERARDPRL